MSNLLSNPSNWETYSGDSPTFSGGVYSGSVDDVYLRYTGPATQEGDIVDWRYIGSATGSYYYLKNIELYVAGSDIARVNDAGSSGAYNNTDTSRTWTVPEGSTDIVFVLGGNPSSGPSSNANLVWSLEAADLADEIVAVDDTAVCPINGSVTIYVTDNDMFNGTAPPPSDKISAPYLDYAPTHGYVQFVDNYAVYTPDPDFYGEDEFGYWVDLSDGSSSSSASVFITVSEPVIEPDKYYVYELDRGWSFDGNYIPHFLELNWYFGENPFVYESMQKIRIHGMAKGYAQLQVAVAGMQTEYDSDYTEPQFIDLPMNSRHVSSAFFPTTNYVDSSNRGLSLQLKFEGRNTDITKPEPAHVLQVLALQSSPQGNGHTSN